MAVITPPDHHHRQRPLNLRFRSGGQLVSAHAAAVNRQVLRVRPARATALALCRRCHGSRLVCRSSRRHDANVNEFSSHLGHFSAQRYLELGECGILSADDHVELLDGLIVAMAPPSPRHDTSVERVQYALLRKLGLEVSTRVQCSFFAGSECVPQPDIMVIPGRPGDYDDSLPTRAFLVIEIALTSLAQDRLTKSAIYARAGVPCYWIVNLRDPCVEVYRDPDRWKSEYRSITRAVGSDEISIDEFPGVTFTASELLPPSGTPTAG